MSVHLRRRIGIAIKVLTLTGSVIGAVVGAILAYRLPKGDPPLTVYTSGGEVADAFMGAVVGLVIGSVASAVDSTAAQVKRSRPTSGIGHILLIVIGAGAGVFLQRFVPGTYGQIVTPYGPLWVPGPSALDVAVPGAFYGAVCGITAGVICGVKADRTEPFNPW